MTITKDYVPKGRKPENYKLHIFDSIPEAVAFARKGHDHAVQASKGQGGWSEPASDQDADYGFDWDDNGDEGWSGAKSFDDAEQMALHGWSAQRPAVDALLEPIREKLAEKLDTVIERQHDLIGYEPDIDRYLAGELECMFEDIHIEAPKMGKVFNLVVNTTVNCGVKPELMRKRGAAIIALVEAFQMLGMDLNIWVENTHDGWGHGYPRGTYLTRAHRAGENLDIDAIMFPLGNPAWLRRLVFGMMELEWGNEWAERMGVPGGYGSAVGVTLAEELEASFVLSLGESSNDMENEPVKWVLDQLLAQGVWDGGDG